MGGILARRHIADRVGDGRAGRNGRRPLIKGLMRILPRAEFAASGAAILALAACSLDSGERTETGEALQDVVGGRAETGYSAVGYLFDPSEPQYPAVCGVTLIAPDVAVTAAHCVWSTRYEVGFGAASTDASTDAGRSASKRTVVKQLIEHPRYQQFQNATWSDAESWNAVRH